MSVKTADIPIGNGKIFPDAPTVITQPKKGQFKAFSAICTHMGCLVDSITTTDGKQ
ncbi:MAG TPA: Rieske (2Fe-2S) protein [Propionibacteriaceae bacterium]|nr:Rieske (2Fe-2S) protein [Propionibacteriaceae bacterium]